MTNVTALDSSSIEVPMDAWTDPFWEAAAEHRLVVPRCGECGLFRWPPGPFCPNCRSQKVEWTEPGAGRVYTFTLVPQPSQDAGQGPGIIAPALIEFADAPGVRLMSSIIETAIEKIRIGAPVRLDWSNAANATVPVFRID